MHRGLPKSWQSTASPTIKSSRSSPILSFAKWSRQKPVCTNTSPSGCHCGSCGHPTHAASSGKYFTQPQSRKKFNPSDIFIPFKISFFHSSNTLSGANPPNGISAHNATVSGAGTSPKRAMNCIALSTRRESSANLPDVWRNILFFKSSLPEYGSTISPVR